MAGPMLPAGKVSGEQCEFPTDHPDFAPIPSIYAQSLGSYRLYEYTDPFDSCHGCVRALNFCYRPGHVSNETLFTVEILRPGPGLPVQSHAVIVYASSDRGNCMTYSPDLSDCCVLQELAEPFQVNTNHHYALRVHGGTSSVLLHHQMLTTNARVMDLGSGNYLSDSVVPRPLFFFIIDNEICSGKYVCHTKSDSK